MSNLQEILDHYAERASRYAINLNGQVVIETGVLLLGGNARVYRGTLQPYGRRVAIKTPRNDLPSDERTIKHILKEVHLWSKLHHENIIPVLGIITGFQSTLSVVSPWMEKRDAHDHVQNIDNDPRPLMMDIARGLQYLHTCKEGPVFHGDLKGPNVLISESGRALLTDFGFSHLVNSTFSMTLSGKRGCTVYWAAPEILNDEEISAAADVWSFGMTLLELFTRKIPFHQFRPRGVLYKILRGETPGRPSNEETHWRLTDPWWTICLKCWEDKPESRPTFAEVIQDITNIYNEKL
ncbi:kinase-like domain-containing protein [Pisolithus croceorrhizus]|nr:kinase-like domain-containing protein [Pisolithus croceorrhizus]KAI6124889.1 kinase-like domain-containing protein [Pisolithus croceorrhizus]